MPELRYREGSALDGQRNDLDLTERFVNLAELPWHHAKKIGVRNDGGHGEEVRHQQSHFPLTDGLAECLFHRWIRCTKENVWSGIRTADNEVPLGGELRKRQPPLADARMSRPHDTDEIFHEQVFAVDVVWPVDPTDSKIDATGSKLFSDTRPHQPAHR